MQCKVSGGCVQEQKKLLQKFEAENDFEALHRMKEEWEAKLEHTKLKTGKSLVTTIQQSRYAIDVDVEPPEGPNAMS